MNPHTPTEEQPTRPANKPGLVKKASVIKAQQARSDRARIYQMGQMTTDQAMLDMMLLQIPNRLQRGAVFDMIKKGLKFDAKYDPAVAEFHDPEMSADIRRHEVLNRMLDKAREISTARAIEAERLHRIEVKRQEDIRIAEEMEAHRRKELEQQYGFDDLSPSIQDINAGRLTADQVLAHRLAEREAKDQVKEGPK
jgi:hypothetical protein